MGVEVSRERRLSDFMLFICVLFVRGFGADIEERKSVDTSRREELRDEGVPV